jgi:hypothetical protein
MSAAEVVSAFLARARRRMIGIAAIGGAGVGITIAIIITFASLDAGDADRARALLGVAAIAGAMAGALAAALLARRARAAREVERRTPLSRNLVLTAAEMIDGPAIHKEYVAELVASEAATAIRSIDLSALFPARRSVAMLGSGVLLWLAAVMLTGAGVPAGPIPIGRSPVSRDGMAAVEVLVTPLAYTGRKTERFSNPTRIEAMAGSRIRLTVAGDSTRIETVEGELQPVSGHSNVFETVATNDGFIAIENGAAARRLIGLVVMPDAVPRVRITDPGKDLFIADSNRRIPVAIEATDDIGLASLSLRYTKVSGSGERFTFTEGESPVTITRATGQRWRATGTLDLASLRLEQGDMVVYRGAATDGRPNAAASESDAFIVEITSPLMVAAEGFSQDDQMDKYALSQQMVILKTERLLARARGMSADSLAYESQMIAAEQRSVRAEFVFMMGGEVAEEVIAAAGMDINEEAEAANESELAAGRLVNRGRVALVDAIRRMSRASTQLNSGDPASALPEEKAALVSLQQAFSRTRYILRALTRRERLDLSRRMTGVLSLAARDRRAVSSPEIDPAVVSLRRALADIATLGASAATDQVPRARAIGLAQRVLQVDPSDTTLQRVAAKLQEAGRELDQARVAEAGRALDDAATALTFALRARLPREAPTMESPELRRLRGALAAARGKETRR